MKLVGNFIKLIVTNKDGRFALYGRNNVKDEWIPVFFEDFPITSYFRFYKNHELLYYGEGGSDNYSEIEIVDNKIVYLWYNEDIKITITYSIVSWEKSKSANTLIIDLRIDNLTEKIFTFDSILCLDTYLGEKSGEHFVVSDNTVINNEQEILDTSTIDYIQSFNHDYKLGINMLFNREKQIAPDRIFFANWKRVDKNIGLYQVTPGINFDLKPYSLNDSALFIEYKEQEIIPHRDHEYRYILNISNNPAVPTEEPSIIPTATPTPPVGETDTQKNNSSVTPTPIPTKEDNNITSKDQKKQLELINLTLTDLLALLDSINDKLKTGQKLSREDVELSRQILDEIKRRRKKY